MAQLKLKHKFRIILFDKNRKRKIFRFPGEVEAKVFMRLQGYSLNWDSEGHKFLAYGIKKDSVVHVYSNAAGLEAFMEERQTELYTSRDAALL